MSVDWPHRVEAMVGLCCGSDQIQTKGQD